MSQASRVQTVAVVGVGLIGGSFALALKKAGFRGRVLGVSSENTIRAAMDRGVIDAAARLSDASAAADLIYIAQPISRILELLPEVARWRRPETLVTDAGSTKSRIVERASGCLPPGAFLGGHPMAGKEARGVEAADPDLFRGRAYILTPAGPDSEAAAEFRRWLEAFGCRILVLDAETHDRVVALTSHLPQLASTALAKCVGEGLSGAEDLATAGPGLTGMTRLALSSYELWRDILATNQPLIRAALDRYIATLEELRDSLVEPQAESAFEAAARVAESLRNPS
ncbi:MAG: prephenate dehydrogenase [Acidobacteria bacterium]|nr:prephenate dehydrogenase [Acidobacteriota bacterium]